MSLPAIPREVNAKGNLSCGILYRQSYRHLRWRHCTRERERLSEDLILKTSPGKRKPRIG